MDDKKREETVEAAKNEAGEAKSDASRKLSKETMEQVAGGGRPQIHRPPQN